MELDTKVCRYIHTHYRPIVSSALVTFLQFSDVRVVLDLHLVHAQFAAADLELLLHRGDEVSEARRVRGHKSGLSI